MERINIPIAWLRALSRVASSDEARYVINGVRVEPRPDGLTLLATDGRRLAAFHTTEFQFTRDVKGFTIPNSMLNLLPLAVMSGRRVGVSIDPVNTIEFEFDDGEGSVIRSRAIDGKYPPWDEVIPKEFPKTFNGRLNVNLDYFDDVWHAGQALLGHSQFSIVSGGETDIILIRGHEQNYGREFIGAVMPVRYSDDAFQNVLLGSKIKVWLD